MGVDVLSFPSDSDSYTADLPLCKSSIQRLWGRADEQRRQIHLDTVRLCISLFLEDRLR